MDPFRRSMRVAFAAALAAAVSGLAVSAAADASCAPPEPLPQRIERADAVVFGRVESLGGPPASVRSAVFVTVKRVYKGNVVERIVLSADPRGGSGGIGQVTATSVDYGVEQGSEHTFYLKQHAPAGFSTNACSGSHPGDLDAEERAVFGPGTPPDRERGGAGSVSDADRAIALAVLAFAFGATFAAARAVLARPA